MISINCVETQQSQTCTSRSLPPGVAVIGLSRSHWDHSWNQRGLQVAMGKSQAAHCCSDAMFLPFLMSPTWFSTDSSLQFGYFVKMATRQSRRTASTLQAYSWSPDSWSCRLLYVLCNIHVCRTQLPAALRAGPSCPCRCRVSPPLGARFPSSWTPETCMWLPAAVVVFSWWPPPIKICPNSS